MQGDQIHAEQAVAATKRVRTLVERAARVQAVRDQVATELEARSREVDELSAKLDILAKVGELFRALMDRLVMSHVRSVESVITEGLRSVFFDQKLSFEAEITQRYNRVNIDFFIRQEHAGGHVIRGRPLTNFGGGPATIASLVLRLMVLMKLKRWPVLLLDETLSAISDEYVDQTSLFLRRLSQSTGIPILLVTQNRDFVEKSTGAYVASERIEEGSPPRLEIHRVSRSSP